MMGMWWTRGSWRDLEHDAPLVPPPPLRALEQLERLPWDDVSEAASLASSWLLAPPPVVSWTTLMGTPPSSNSVVQPRRTREDCGEPGMEPELPNTELVLRHSGSS